MALILAIGSRAEQALQGTYWHMLTLEALQLFSEKTLAISKLSNMHTNAHFISTDISLSYWYSYELDYLFV